MASVKIMIHVVSYLQDAMAVSHSFEEFFKSLHVSDQKDHFLQMGSSKAAKRAPKLRSIYLY